MTTPRNTEGPELVDAALVEEGATVRPSATAGAVFDEPAVSAPSMEKAAKSGVAWTTGSRVLLLVLQFGSSIALARLLTPDQFGLVAIVTAFTGFALLFTDLGLGSAIIHSDRVTDELVSTAFWLNALTGVLLTGLLCGLAYPIALFFGYPELTGLLILASFTFTLSAGTVGLALLERSMRFKIVVGVEVVATFFGFAVSVACAAAGLGASSMIWGVLVQTTITTVLFWRASRWRPHTFVSRAALRDLWAFSSHLFGFNIVNYWSRNLDDLLIAKFVDTASLALYSRAYQLMLLPVQQVTVSVGRVLFPSLARLRHERLRLQVAYLRVVTMLVGVVAPLSIGLSASSTAFVAVTYGPQWGGAAAILAVLAASGPAQVISGTGGALYRAVGRTKSMFRRSLVNTSLTIAAILVGLHWGVMGVAVALLVKFYALTPMTLRGAWKDLDLTVPRVLWGVRGLILSSVLMAAAMLAGGWLVRDEPKIIVLLVQVVAGVVVYALSVMMFAKGFVSEVLALLGRGRVVAS